jgi:hypothetical protein
MTRQSLRDQQCANFGAPRVVLVVLVAAEEREHALPRKHYALPRLLVEA